MFHQLLSTSAEGKEVQCPPLELHGNLHFKGRRPRPQPGSAFRPLQAAISILFFPGRPALPPPAGILPFRRVTSRRKKIGYLAQVLFSPY